MATSDDGERSGDGRDQTARILKERALALARRRESSAAPADELEVVAFGVSGERYGIESHYVSEVVELKHLTPLPMVPRFILGIMNLQGEILSVVDLGKLFDRPERGLTDTDCVIVVGNGTMEFGLLANRIDGLLDLPRDAMHAPPASLTGMSTELLRGVTADGMAILDGKRLLSDERLVVRQSG